MDNNLLKYIAFVETVDKGSFTKAAESLNYAQSSVSKMIADLEKEWGVVLLQRNKKGVCLTSSGEQILPFVRRILNDFGELQGKVNEIKGIQSGIVKIGTFSSVAINWLPNIFAKFQEDYPGIDYEMLLGDYEEVERWIEEGRVDCGFLRLPANTDLDVIKLKSDEYKAVLPVNHPLTQKEKLNIVRGFKSISHFYCWSMEAKQKCLNCWRKIMYIPIYVLSHGRIMRSCQWWKEGWGSVCFRI